MRCALLVSYDGTDFSGYQRQAQGERTVQEELERAAAEIFGAPVRVVASGRTDAGVHAAGQVCHLDCETTIPPERLFLCFNRLLPPDLRVLASAPAPEGFDASSSAKRKTYVYSAYLAESELPLVCRYAARLKRKPDLAAMKRAAELLEGEHDFAAFSSAGSSAKTSVRTVYRIEISSKTLNGGTMYEISVTGNGFLYNMVRILAGELFAVGYGKELGQTALALGCGERSLVAETMPPEGLRLERVDYGFPLFGERS